jgi:hypothetical protein
MACKYSGFIFSHLLPLAFLAAFPTFLSLSSSSLSWAAAPKAAAKSFWSTLVAYSLTFLTVAFCYLWTFSSSERRASIEITSFLTYCPYPPFFSSLAGGPFLSFFWEADYGFSWAWGLACSYLYSSTVFFFCYYFPVLVFCSFSDSLAGAASAALASDSEVPANIAFIISACALSTAALEAAGLAADFLDASGLAF